VPAGDLVLRILYVGPAANLPADLVGYIVDLGDDWHVDTVADGNTAIALLSSQAVDVILVAPALPDITPSALLGQARTLRPETIRIALIAPSSSHSSPPPRIIGVAHRFLPLPLSPEMLLEAVTSIEELRDLLDNERLRDTIGRIEKLPSPPSLYLRLSRALEQDENADIGEIARLVAGDPAIAAKVLQLCNSAYFSSGRIISDLRTAINRLGLSTLRDLVLFSEVFSMPRLSQMDYHAMQHRALLASRMAAKILPGTSAELGSTAALLADIGLLLPGVRNEHAPIDSDPGVTPVAGHTEAGAYLLGLWGLPMPIVEAVAFQRTPARSNARSFWVTGAVHVAVAMTSGEPVDEAYLARVGVLGQLPAWAAQHAELAAMPAGNF
jgi:HD-like signal output (HDOD) protein/CheY-like chemotaxis protein